ncbi:hypothetical protein D3C87_1264000 [compost metagenome]
MGQDHQGAGPGRSDRRPDAPQPRPGNASPGCRLRHRLGRRRLQQHRPQGHCRPPGGGHRRQARAPCRRLRHHARQGPPHARSRPRRTLPHRTDRTRPPAPRRGADSCLAPHDQGPRDRDPDLRGAAQHLGRLEARQREGRRARGRPQRQRRHANGRQHHARDGPERGQPHPARALPRRRRLRTGHERPLPLLPHAVGRSAGSRPGQGLRAHVARAPDQGLSPQALLGRPRHGR